MSGDTIDFHFALTFHRVIPEWAWGRELETGRATRAAIEELHGPIPPGMPLEDAFEQVADGIKNAAAEKVVLLQGQFEPPVIIDRGDV